MFHKKHTLAIVGGLGLSFLFFCGHAKADEIATTTEKIVTVEAYSFVTPAEHNEYNTSADPCEKIYNCGVPAPTVIHPEEQTTYRNGAVIVTGLSWNETKVDVYIDRTFAGRATLRTDESGVGNFIFYSSKSLSYGKHSVYTVARSMNEWDRSPETPAIEFFVQPTITKKIKPMVPEQKINEENVVKATSTEKQNANSLLDWFFNKKNSETGASTSATSTVPETSGYKALLIAFIAISILGYVIQRARKRSIARDDTSPPDQFLPPDDPNPPSAPF